MVARKEIADIVRDRRTMLVTLVTAIVAGPVLMLLVLNLIARQTDKVRELTLPVIGIERAPALKAFLERQQLTLTPAPADFDARIKTGDLDVVLEIDAAFADDVAQGRPGTVRLAYDRSRDRARASIAEVEGLLRAFNREWGRGRLILRGIAPEVANPLSIELRDLATPQSSGALVLFLIAFYGLFAAVMGGMAAALDTTAGERERMSLEPLLTTPVGPLELAMGKWLAVSLLNATAVVLTLIGVLSHAALRAAAGGRNPVPVRARRIRALRRRADSADPADARDPALRRLSRPHVQGGAIQPVGAAVRGVVAPDRADVPAKEGAGVAHLDSRVGPVHPPSRALRGEALPSLELLQSYVVPGILTLVALLAVARLFSRESLLAGK